MKNYTKQQSTKKITKNSQNIHEKHRQKIKKNCTKKIKKNEEKKSSKYHEKLFEKFAKNHGSQYKNHEKRNKERKK